ncbi:MAG: hypothetical protein L6R37_007734 [Teloschistes peruensis]|nr:MAG: hypothetical protein L6R37_007734 [Teloschistes peruensis]
MLETPGKMYALAAVLSFLAIAATVLRFYARYIKKAGYSWDDMVLLPALIFTIATAVCIICGTALGDMGRHTKTHSEVVEGVTYLVPDFTHRTHVFQMIVYATNLTTVLTFGFTKLAVLFFYQRYVDPFYFALRDGLLSWDRVFQGRWVQRGIWIMVGVTFLWTVGFFFSELLQCVPISANWKGFGFDPAACGVNANVMIMAQTWSDIATNGQNFRCSVGDSMFADSFRKLDPDILRLTWLITLQIWALQMPPRRKLAVCGIFLLGFLTVGAGIAKLAVYYDMLARAASRGFMRDLQSVDIPTSERSDTLWNKSEQRVVDDWNSLVSTVRYGSDSLGTGEHFKEKKMPSLPSSSLDMLKDTPTQGLWMKQPRVPQDMV